MKHTLYERNKLLLTLYAATVLSGIVGNYFSGLEASLNLLVASIGGGTILLLALLVFKRWLVSQTKYIFALALGALTYLVGITHPEPSAHTMIYYSLALLSLYLDSRLIIVSGLINLGLVNVDYVTLPGMFQPHDPKELFIYNEMLVLVIVLLLVQNKIGERLRKESEQSADNAQAAKRQTESVLQNVNLTAAELDQFRGALKQNVTTTGHISKELFQAFQEIAAGIEAQSNNVNEVRDSIEAIDEGIQVVSQASENTKRLSQSTANMTVEGSQHVATLSQQMTKVDVLVHETVLLMNELREKNRSINDILQTITTISQQTNLLALNAAIESARAGVHGKSFAVVAEEIRSLADHSRKSTKEITNILEEIQVKTNIVSDKIIDGQSEIREGLQVATKTESIFGLISETTESVRKQSVEVEELVKTIQGNSHAILKDITSVAGITEEAAASVEEVVASAEEQQKQIDEIVTQFRVLERLMVNLSALVKEGQPGQ
ncbi:methyl-accepting chemotaxis protein [Brevibacillus fluminis]|nr:methyl-accepting chemotaxis protein [Brevibacillus fluminis]